MGGIDSGRKKMILTDREEVKKILNFDKGVYLLIAVARKKDNEGITNSQEIVMREIVTSMDKFDKKYDRLVRQIAGYPDANFKLYVTFNPKNIIKAYSKLKERFASWDFEMMNMLLKGKKEIYNETYNRVANIQYEWISCLQKSPANKEWFMLDVDTKDKYDLAFISDSFSNVLDMDMDELQWFPTQNGEHCLFKPCDTRALMKELKNIDVELKRDDLLCIGYYEKEEIIIGVDMGYPELGITINRPL